MGFVFAVSLIGVVATAMLISPKPDYGHFASCLAFSIVTVVCELGVENIRHSAPAVNRLYCRHRIHLHGPMERFQAIRLRCRFYIEGGQCSRAEEVYSDCPLSVSLIGVSTGRQCLVGVITAVYSALQRYVHRYMWTTEERDELAVVRHERCTAYDRQELIGIRRLLMSAYAPSSNALTSRSPSSS